MKAFVKKIMISVYRILNAVLPKSKRIVVFSTSNGKSAGGNPRAIYEYAVAESRSKYKAVWFLTGEFMRKKPEEVDKLRNTGLVTCKIVQYGHPAYYWYMARAGLWVFDSRQEPYIEKKPGVKYLQTWHGTPLKKLGLDMDAMNMAGENVNIDEYREAFRREAAQWDYLIAQNSFSSETFRRCFDFKGEMLEIGYPRNDELVTAEGKSGKDDKKILLYAPTWRDDKYLSNGWYAYSSPLDLKQMYEELGEDYRIFIKPHYLVKIRNSDIPRDMVRNGFVKICGQGDDINELYLRADGLITDYSSAMFDYSLLNRPMFFYAYDMEDYAENLRGFYFDFEAEAPGPICRTTGELAEAVKEAFEPENADSAPGKDHNTKYAAQISRFIEKYNTFDDGNAARKAWEALTGKG